MHLMKRIVTNGRILRSDRQRRNQSYVIQIPPPSLGTYDYSLLDISFTKPLLYFQYKYKCGRAVSEIDEHMKSKPVGQAKGGDQSERVDTRKAKCKKLQSVRNG